MTVIGDTAKQKRGGWLNNRVENSHRPFRSWEVAMPKIRALQTFDTCASVRAIIHNHFNHRHHFNNRNNFKKIRTAALVEWRQMAT
jgi:putative transposase